MREVLVTGATGQVGRALGRAVWPGGWRPIMRGREELDLADPQALAAAVAERPWAAVVNAAAYTAVDRAEDEVVAAWRINALAPAALATACAAAGTPLVHVSTDYVFAGDKDGAWEVDDPTEPLGVYGASKLGGELAVTTAGGRYAIVRTAWVVSSDGHNFVKTMLRLAAKGEALRIVADQSGSPTSAADLAAALIEIAVRLADDPAARIGTFHFSNAGATTWAAFAVEIFRCSAARGGPAVDVVPVATRDYPTRAPRPANSMLSHSAIGAAYGIAPRPWQAALGDVIAELMGEQA